MPRRYQKRNFVLFTFWTGIFTLGWAMPGIVRVSVFELAGCERESCGDDWLTVVNVHVGLITGPAISRRYTRKKWLQFLLSMPSFLSEPERRNCHFGVDANRRWPLGYQRLRGLFRAMAVRGGMGRRAVSGIYSKLHIARAHRRSRGGVTDCRAAVGAARLGVYDVSDGAFAGSIQICSSLYSGLCSGAGGGVTITVCARDAHRAAACKPFWRPAVMAMRDARFKRLVIIASMCQFVVMFPYAFIPFLAIREWAMPDWVAGVYMTVLMGSNMARSRRGYLGWAQERLPHIHHGRPGHSGCLHDHSE